MNLKGRGRERRRHERQLFSERQDELHFSICVQSEEYPVITAQDVSISGIRICIPGYFAVGEEMRLRVAMEDFEVTLLGAIRWRRELDDGVCEYGVEFANDDMDDNILFFMSLRKYLQDFDHIVEKEA